MLRTEGARADAGRSLGGAEDFPSALFTLPVSAMMSLKTCGSCLEDTLCAASESADIELSLLDLPGSDVPLDSDVRSSLARRGGCLPEA